MLSTTLLTSAKMTKRKPKGFDCSSPTPDKRQIVKLLKVSTPLCSSIVLVISNLSDKCWTDTENVKQSRTLKIDEISENALLEITLV